MGDPGDKGRGNSHPAAPRSLDPAGMTRRLQASIFVGVLTDAQTPCHRYIHAASRMNGH